MPASKRNRKRKGKGPSGNSGQNGAGSITSRPENTANNEQSGYAQRAHSLFVSGANKIDMGDRKGGVADLQEAIALCNQAIDFSPSLADPYVTRGTCNALLENNVGAISDFDHAIELNPNRADAYYLRGASKATLSDHQGAIADYEQALNLGLPPILEALVYVDRGNSKADIGDYSGAVADYSDAITVDALDDPDLTALTYYNRADGLANLGNHQEAIADLDASIDLGPDKADAYFNRGNSKLHLEHFSEAIKDYDYAIALEANHSGALANRGLAKFRLSDFGAALDDIDQAIALTDDEPTLYLARCHAKLSSGDYSGAVDDIDLAIFHDIEAHLGPVTYGGLMAMRGSIHHQAETARLQSENVGFVEIADEAITDRDQALARNAELEAQLQQITAENIYSPNTERKKRDQNSAPTTNEVGRIDFYLENRGRIPFVDWLVTLARAQRRQILDTVAQMAQGNFGDHKRLDAGGLLERRLIDAGLRIYYGWGPGRTLVLLGGSGKNTTEQTAEIKRASERLADWKERYER